MTNPESKIKTSLSASNQLEVPWLVWEPDWRRLSFRKLRCGRRPSYEYSYWFHYRRNSPSSFNGGSSIEAGVVEPHSISFAVCDQSIAAPLEGMPTKSSYVWWTIHLEFGAKSAGSLLCWSKCQKDRVRGEGMLSTDQPLLDEIPKEPKMYIKGSTASRAMNSVQSRFCNRKSVDRYCSTPY